MSVGLYRIVCIALLFTATKGLTQHTDTCRLKHEMSPCEARFMESWNRDFILTPPPTGPVRMIAEFEQMQSVLIRYPFGVPMSLISEMAEDCHVTTIVEDETDKLTVINIYLGAGIDTSVCEFILAPTNSYWTRDYGPWFIVDGNNEIGVCDFPYNRPRPYDDEIPVIVAGYLGIDLYGMQLEHTGGNWMCDGYGNASSTELVWDENPSLSHDSVNELVLQYLGISNYHVLPDPLGEYIQHIDCWGKYLDVDKVLIGEVPLDDSRYDDFEFVASYFENSISGWGNNYQVYRVFTPGGDSITPYTNSLILNKKVFVPLTGSIYDTAALQVYEEAMPGYEVIGIEYPGWHNTDALHCRTKGMADTGMLHIRHIPLLGYRSFEENWVISAAITPCSHQGLVGDSLWISYSIDSGAFQQVSLTLDTNDTYSAVIPFQFPGSEIAYYIHALDSTGRVAEHPFIGQPDPHTFLVDTVPCVWKGVASASWMDPLNWHDGKLPGPGKPVYVKDNCLYYPVLPGTLSVGTATGDFSCGSLTIMAGGSLTVTGSLQVSPEGILRIASNASLEIVPATP